MARKKKGPLNPEGTRNSILDAAFALLAENGPNGVSFSEVARLADVDRGTAHRHFQTREELLKSTVERVSEKLTEAVFGKGVPRGWKTIKSAEVLSHNRHLIKFGMENPVLCRIWLFEILSSEDPLQDGFYKKSVEFYEEFSQSDAAQDKLNVEVLVFIMLAGSFLWPIWTRARAKSEAAKQNLEEIFSREMLRLSMFGSLKPERFPEIARLLEEAPAPTKLGKGGRKKAAAAED